MGCSPRSTCPSRTFLPPIGNPIQSGWSETRPMAANPHPDPQESVAEAARRAFTEAGGDVREASRLMEQAVRSSRRLRDEITEPLVASACYAAVRAQCRVQRRKVWSPSDAALARHREDGANRVVHLAADTLLAFPLPGGLRLGEATRGEIAEAADFYAAQADDMGTKARWLRLVAQAVPDQKTAGAVLTEKRLRELQDAAREG